MTCKHCNCEMVPGKALVPIYGGLPDFYGGSVVTVSPTGKTKLIDCLKCPKCGYSVSVGEE